MWEVTTTVAFDEWFGELGESERIEVIAKVDLLKGSGQGWGAHTPIR